MRTRSEVKATSAVFVSLLLLGALFVLTSGVAIANQDGDYVYTTSGTNATITHYAGTGGAITIPSTVGGFVVVAIGDSAFSDCTSLTSVIIPSSVTSLGNFTFFECTSLTSVTIPNSITSIGRMVFYKCTSLTSVTIPDSVTSIGYWAFEYCSSLTSVTIPRNVTSIGSLAFASCTSLTAIDVNASNPAYASVDGVLYNKFMTILIQCPSQRAGAFTIPSSVMSIEGDAFGYCSSLTSVMIHGDVTSIGDDAFYSCTSLTSIEVNASNPNYASIDGVLYNKDETTLIQCPGGKAGAITIPSSVTYIGVRGFYSCISMISVIIPDSVTSMGESAFSSCTSLTSVTISDNITMIGNLVFVNCTSLTSVIIPDSVTSIWSASFYECSSLASVTIGRNVTSISGYAFAKCPSLTSITFLGLVAPTRVSQSWIADTPAAIRGHAYAASNFPAPDGVWNGLTMGAAVPSNSIPVSPRSDDTILMVAIVAIALAMVAVLAFLLMRSKAKK